jgi:hypothetical protein
VKTAKAVSTIGAMKGSQLSSIEEKELGCSAKGSLAGDKMQRFAGETG